MNWEVIDNHHLRCPIFGGWLVKANENVTYFTDNQGYTTGWDYRIAMAFVPDPGHEWKLGEEGTSAPQRTGPKVLKENQIAAVKYTYRVCMEGISPAAHEAGTHLLNTIEEILNAHMGAAAFAELQQQITQTQS